MANRDRNQQPYQHDFPNIEFEYPLADSGIVLVGYLSQNARTFSKYLHKIWQSGHTFQEISPNLAKGLKNPEQKISLVERIALQWK